MIEVKKYTIDSGLKEVHMVGKYVGVWWGFQQRMETKTIVHEGIEYSAQVPNYVLTIGPMIGLLNVREVYSKDKYTGEYWLDDDPPIEVDYINFEQAEQIAQELRLAVEYIQSLK